MTYEVGGDPAQLAALAETQEQYRTRFIASMNEVRATAQATLAQWEGAGTEGFHRRSAEFDSHFEATMAAFSRLIEATSGAATGYQRLGQQLNDRFA